MLAGIFNRADLPELDLAPAYLRDAWLPDLQVMTARAQAGSDRGLFLAAKGGHNAESHNHNDVGSFVVYLDGHPVVVDVGVESYSAKTFSPRRYEIWTMQSGYHNLPTVSGTLQEAGREFRAAQAAYATDDTRAELSLDLAGAYPPSAGLRAWRRTCRLVRGASPAVEIADRFALAAPTADLTLSLMTCCEPVEAEPGLVLLSGEEGPVARLTYAAAALALEIERLPVEDAQLQAAWGDHLYRMVLRPRAEVGEGEWVVRIEAV